MRHYHILGQSNYAVAVLLDLLRTLHPATEPLEVDIVANLPAADNDSLAFAYDTPGVTTRAWQHPDWQPTPDVPCLVGSIGKGRRAIVQFFLEHYGITPERYPSLVHPSAVCPATVQHGFGLHISPLSVVAPHAALGHFVVVNRNASVGHHTTLEDFVTINPGVNVAGCCHLGTGVTVGAGATVLDRVRIGAGTIVGAGSVVTKDLPAGVVAYGSPAKVIREIG